MNKLEILLSLKNETLAGFAQVNKNLEAVEKQIGKVSAAQTMSSASALKMGAAIGIASEGFRFMLPYVEKVGTALVSMTYEFAKAGSSLTDLKNQTGMSVLELQKLQYAARQTGVDSASLTTAIMQMEKAASKTPEKFAQLGISFAEIRNAKPYELMGMISDGLKNVPEESERARISMELFGRGGSQVLRLLMEDFRGLTEEAEKTGLMTDEMAERGDELDDTLARLDDTLKNLRVNLAAAFASPEMVSVMGQMADVIGFMARNAEKLAAAAKMIALSPLDSWTGGMGSWLVGSGMSLLAGPQMPSFGGVTGGGSSSAAKVNDTIAGNSSAVIKANLRDLESMGKEAEKAAKLARKSWADFFDDMRDSAFKTSRILAESLRDTNRDMVLAMGPNADTFALPVQTDTYGKPKQYSFDNSHNYAGPTSLPKSADEASKALQAFANIATLSTSKLGRTMAQVFGSGAGVASGIDAFGSAKNLLGKLGAVGSIASAGIGVVSGIIGLFKNNDKEKKERAAAAAAAKAQAAEEEKLRRQAGLTSAASGLNAFTRGGGITDQASSDRAGMYAGAIFGGQVKETGDVVGALRAIGPALAEMAAKAKEFGFTIGAGVSNLLAMNGVLEANGGLADQLSGLNQMMRGLADANMMNKDLFAALGADASAVFARLVEGGATGTQAMAMMQPTLQQLYEAQKRHGYAVDETTQAMLDEAEAQGVVGDQFMSANERMVELLGILVETLGGTLPESMRRMGDAAEREFARMGSAADQASSRIPGFHDPETAGDGSGLGGPGFASGTPFRNFGGGTRVTLHGEEAVLTRPQVDRLVSMAVSGAPGSTVPQGGGRPIVVHVMMDGRVAATAVTNTLEGEGPEAQRFRQAYAGRE